MRQKLRQKQYLRRSSTTSTAGTPKTKKHRVKNAASSKTEKSDGSEWWVIVILQMMCNQNKNSTGSIDGSQGFARCAQIWLATKIGGATAIQKLWVKWTVGYWSPMGTSIVWVCIFRLKYILRLTYISGEILALSRWRKIESRSAGSKEHPQLCLWWNWQRLKLFFLIEIYTIYNLAFSDLIVQKCSVRSTWSVP